MNILIVDDEIYILRALKTRIHWEELGIDGVFTALNVAKAREILSSETIDLLLTDIEMPGETGLQLMEWVRQQGLCPVSACLTCHADFQYAQTAITLGFSDYILKPVNFQALEETVRRLAEKAVEQRETRQQTEKGKLWELWERSAAGSFWKSVISGTAGQTPDEIVRSAEQTGTRYRFDSPYTLLLFTPVNGEEAAVQWGDRELLRYAVSNVLQEKLLSLENPERLIWDGDRIWVVSEESPRQLAGETLPDTLQVSEELLGVRLACYCGGSAFGEEIGAEAEALLALSRNNTREKGGVFTASAHPALPPETPDGQQRLFRDFSQAALEQLRAGDFSALAEDAEALLDRVAMGQEALRRFMRLIFQTTDHWLMEAGKLPMDIEGLDDLHGASGEVATVQQAKDLVRELAALLPQPETPSESSAVRRAKEYIDRHITERLTRDEIAESVFLSPDYLTRVFRRETGSSLMGYIAERKAEAAKKLLRDHTVSEAAQILGYDNFGYFSELFKRKTGMTPSEYRRKNGN